MPRPKIWETDAQKQEAYRIRQIHPTWSNEVIAAFMEGRDIALREAEKKEFEELQRNASIPPKVLHFENIPLLELIDLHRVPTGYVSPLNDVDWINYYLNTDFFGGGTLYDTQIEISKHFNKNIWAAADVWRGVGKSMYAFGFIIRRMCDNPNIRLFIITEESTRSIQRINLIKHIFKTNKRIIHDYGYLPHDKAYKGIRGKWSSKMLQLKRTIVAQEPTLIGLSQGATDMLGYHFDGGLIDDPWSTEIQRIKGAKEKWLNWFTETFLGCIEKGAFCLMLFTRKGVDDLYSDIIYKRGLFVPIRRPAIIKYPSKYHYVYNDKKLPIIDQELGVPMVVIESDDGVIYDSCHGRFTMAYLLGKRKQQGRAKFEQEYQCNPVHAEGSLLNWKSLKFYNDPTFKIEDFEYPDRELVSWVAFFDQAFGMSDRADFSVITIFGYYASRIYFDQIYRGKWTPFEKIQKVKQVFKDYPKLTKMGIESGLIQTFAAKQIIEALPSLPLTPVDQRGAGRNYNLAVGSVRELDAKIIRIHDQWSVPLVAGNLYVNAEMDHFDDFEHEFRYLGTSEHDDIMDSSGSALEMINTSQLYHFFMDGTSSYTHFQTF
jgi:phage terminase large subunit-like protein